MLSWTPDISPRSPSSLLLETFRRQSKTFSLVPSKAVNRLYFDTLLLEIVPEYPQLKIWKFDTEETADAYDPSAADYLIAPKRAYLAAPLLCCGVVAEDSDFAEQQEFFLAKMATCRDNNRRDNHEIDVYGIVSNGQVWVFYKLSLVGEVFISGEYVMTDLPKLLGVFDFVCAACAQNVP